MKVLIKSQVLLLHKALLEAFGGAEGLRDEGLLDSALAAPFHSFLAIHKRQKPAH